MPLRASNRAGMQSGRKMHVKLACSASGTQTSLQQMGVCDAAARRYWEGMNRRDVDHALEQFSDDIFFQDMLFPEPIRGKAELRSHFDRCLAGNYSNSLVLSSLFRANTGS
jgi:hypothetical protein